MKINLKVISLFLIIFLISISVSYAVDIENETLTEVNESTISNNNENPKNLEFLPMFLNLYQHHP